MLDIKDLYLEDYIGKEITVSGWVRNHRKQAHFGFIDLSDGTYFKNLQVVYDDTLNNFDDITKLKLGSAITVTGKLIESPKEGQKFELVLSYFTLEGDCYLRYRGFENAVMNSRRCIINRQIYDVIW